MRRYSFYIDGSHFTDLMCDVVKEPEKSSQRLTVTTDAMKKYVKDDIEGELVHEKRDFPEGGCEVYVYYSRATKQCSVLTVTYSDDVEI